MNDRARQQADLIYYLGLLLQPFEELVQHPERFTPAERSRVGAKYYAEKSKFHQLIEHFCEGEPGHSYQREAWQMNYALNMFDHHVREHLDDSIALSAKLAETREAILNAALRVPVDHGTVLLEERTPFSTALALRSRLEAARNRVVLVDRYIDGSVYFRLLSATRSEAEVIVVTWPESKHSAARWQSLLTASRLFAQERGSQYTIAVSEDIHARWMQIDDRYYIFSESFKDAGASAPLSLTLADDPAGLATRIQSLLAGATILVGPGQSTHP